MTLEDWHQAQEVDPVLSLVIARLQDGTLEKGQSKVTDQPKVSQYRWEHNHILVKQGILYRWARPRESEETLLQLVLPAAQREVALRDAMIRLAIWAWSACLISCTTGSSGLAWLLTQENTLGNATCVLPSKPDSPRPPSKTSWPQIL